VALAAVLSADACEIYTDVDGVYTTDPRVLPEARRVNRVSYDEMLELASLGAGVMHNRSIEFAKKFSVPIHVRSSFSDVPGTMISVLAEAKDQPVGGAALAKNEARVTILGIPDQPGTSFTIFSEIAVKAISVDMIVQNVGAEGLADLSFTVLRDDLPATLKAAEHAAARLKAEGVTCGDDVAKVSVVGLGMAKQTGVARRMFRALADEGVNILMITTGDIKISVLVERSQGVAALAALHRAFALEKEPTGAGNGTELKSLAHHASDAVAVVARLQKMEELAIDDISLDDTQSRITISGIPDRPGIAAAIFDTVADGGIFVDMIVQSYGREGKAKLSFTVPRAQFQECLAIVNKLASANECGPITAGPTVAKLSISGIGMRSHTEVAIRTFQCLAEAGINVDMINTSEVRLNVVVDGGHGQRALEALQQAFADARQ
jgi:aspartate kinase